MSDEKPVKIRNWSLCVSGDVYTAPEIITQYVHGEIYDHPTFSDGTIVNTSYIKGVEGKLITTNSRVYELDGPPSEEYMKYLKSINYQYDPENPIKVIDDR
jgi:hypothetical protein